jgi:hypothetical protein
MSKVEVLGPIVVIAVKQYLGPVVKALNDRLDALEGRPDLEPIKGDPGKDGEDGSSVTLADVEPLLKELVSALPPAEKGADGTSVSVDDVLPQLREDMRHALDSLPRPKDGKSVTIDEVMEQVTPALEAMHSKWALDFERRMQDVFQRSVDRMPAPKDGVDGKDGLGFDEMAADFDGERTVTLRWTRDSQAKEFPLVLPIPVYQGTYSEAKDYARGDTVTWGGSQWTALKSAPEGQPGNESTDWKLTVKRGDRGKQGEVLVAPTTFKFGDKK